MTYIPRRLCRPAGAADKPKEGEKPEGYRYSQTDGYASVERVSRRFEYGERSRRADMPIVFGFRPNEERS